MPDSIPSLAELRGLPPVQQPSYDDPAQEQSAVDRLRQLPPLVFAGECDDLRLKLAEVAAGRAFLSVVTAETFAGVNANNIMKLRMCCRCQSC